MYRWVGSRSFELYCAPDGDASKGAMVECGSPRVRIDMPKLVAPEPERGYHLCCYNSSDADSNQNCAPPHGFQRLYASRMPETVNYVEGFLPLDEVEVVVWSLDEPATLTLVDNEVVPTLPDEQPSESVRTDESNAPIIIEGWNSMPTMPTFRVFTQERPGSPIFCTYDEVVAVETAACSWHVRLDASSAVANPVVNTVVLLLNDWELRSVERASLETMANHKLNEIVAALQDAFPTYRVVRRKSLGSRPRLTGYGGVWIPNDKETFIWDMNIILPDQACSAEASAAASFGLLNLTERAAWSTLLGTSMMSEAPVDEFLHLPFQSWLLKGSVQPRNPAPSWFHVLFAAPFVVFCSCTIGAPIWVYYLAIVLFSGWVAGAPFPYYVMFAVALLLH